MTTFLNPPQPAMSQTPTPKASFWDPDGSELSEYSFVGARKELESKFATYQKQPQLPLRNLLLLCVPLAIELLLVLIFSNILRILMESNNGKGLFLLFLPLLPPLWFFD